MIDEGSFFEIKPAFARNIITGYARLNGRTVGIVANQSMEVGGVIDVDAANKAARFVRICDSFNIPLIQLQDSPAVMIGVEEEHNNSEVYGELLGFNETKLKDLRAEDVV
ncbi:MAG: hypothetical protein C4589_10930 [Peptococcaceae bacterium]|nr:MAG: hypothetical protein C4589_10930 [Peptococcaceae bacterium]